MTTVSITDEWGLEPPQAAARWIVTLDDVNGLHWCLQVSASCRWIWDFTAAQFTTEQEANDWAATVRRYHEINTNHLLKGDIKVVKV